MRYLLLLALAFPLNAFAIGAVWPISDSPRSWPLGEGLHHLSLDTAYFHSTENYNSLGNSYRPTYLDKVDYISSRLNAGFGVTRQFSVFGQLELRDLIMKANRFAAAAPLDGKKVGPGDAFLGLRWLVYDSHPTTSADRAHWVPASFLALVEGSWNFPLYKQAAAGQPPLGDKASDLSAIARAAWYANECFGFSGSIGYIYRTAHYAALLPWSLRAEFSLAQERGIRAWAELQSLESLRTPSYALNPSQPDPSPIPSRTGAFCSKAIPPLSAP